MVLSHFYILLLQYPSGAEHEAVLIPQYTFNIGVHTCSVFAAKKKKKNPPNFQYIHKNTLL